MDNYTPQALACRDAAGQQLFDAMISGQWPRRIGRDTASQMLAIAQDLAAGREPSAGRWSQVPILKMLAPSSMRLMSTSTNADFIRLEVLTRLAALAQLGQSQHAETFAQAARKQAARVFDQSPDTKERDWARRIKSFEDLTELYLSDMRVTEKDLPLQSWVKMFLLLDEQEIIGANALLNMLTLCEISGLDHADHELWQLWTRASAPVRVSGGSGTRRSEGAVILSTVKSQDDGKVLTDEAAADFQQMLALHRELYTLQGLASVQELWAQVFGPQAIAYDPLGSESPKDPLATMNTYLIQRSDEKPSSLTQRARLALGTLDDDDLADLINAETTVLSAGYARTPARTLPAAQTVEAALMQAQRVVHLAADLKIEDRSLREALVEVEPDVFAQLCATYDLQFEQVREQNSNTMRLWRRVGVPIPLAEDTASVRLHFIACLGERKGLFVGKARQAQAEQAEQVIQEEAGFEPAPSKAQTSRSISLVLDGSRFWAAPGSGFFTATTPLGQEALRLPAQIAMAQPGECEHPDLAETHILDAKRKPIGMQVVCACCHQQLSLGLYDALGYLAESQQIQLAALRALIDRSSISKVLETREELTIDQLRATAESVRKQQIQKRAWRQEISDEYDSFTL